MKLTIEATSKEMADLVKELQNQPNKTISIKQIIKSWDDAKISRI